MSSATRTAPLEFQHEQLLGECAGLRERAEQVEARVEDLEGDNARLRAESRRLKRENRRLRDENRWLRSEVRRLGGRLKPPVKEEEPSDDVDAEGAREGEDGAPPASDSRRRGDRRKRKGKRRKPGGQPGHEPKNRQLLPPECVDHFEVVKPDGCRRCGAALSGTDPRPRRHQVSEAPEPRAVVTEWQLHGLRCGDCGTVTLATLPDGVPRRAFGPRLEALVGYLTGACRLSKRAAQEFLEDVYGVTMSLGSISACERAVGDALADPYDEAVAYVQEQPVKLADETGWIEGSAKAYLWTVVTTFVTVFAIRARRTRKAAEELLGRVKGVLITDRFAAYLFWPDRLHQFCWAHLKRRFEEFLLSDAVAKNVGTKLLAEHRKLFDLWYRVRDGTGEPLSRSQFKREVRPIRRRVEALLREGKACTDSEVAGTCRELLKHKAALWTFVHHEGVEPTSNAAERALRHGVLWRRVSFGTHSAKGSRFVERMLTARATLRQQGRNVLDYLIAACEAARSGKASPSLLPESAARREPVRDAAA